MKPGCIARFLVVFSLGLSACNPKSDDAGGGGGGSAAGAGGTGGRGGAGGSGAGGSAATGGSAGGASGGSSGSGGSGAGGTQGGTAAGSGGSTGGSGGTTGGSGGTAPALDAAPDTTGSAMDGASEAPTGPPDPPPLMECMTPSVDRLQRWLAHANIVGSGGRASILVKEGDKYAAKARFPGGNYSEVVVLIGNQEAGMVDLSDNAGFTVKYSATADLWMQLRGAVMLHGGAQWAARLPATGGATMSKFIPFQPSAWQAPLGQPPHTLAQAVQTANFFDIVGNTANTVAFYGLRFDKYVPTCR